MEQFEYYIENEIGERIDKFITEHFENYSRSFIQNLISNGNVSVNDNVNTKKNYKLKKNDKVSIVIPEPVKLDVVAENIPINIIYEDDEILVVDKPKGMVVHPAPGNYSGTLVNSLMFHVDKLSSINGVIRPGIVHRIDKDTSGLLVIAKTDNAHHFLSNLLKEHDIKRIYYAIVHGKITKSGTIDKPIARNPRDRLKMAIVKDGRNAITHYTPLQQFGNDYTLVKIELETGRTHQIRIHMKSIGHPVLGDPLYGVKKEKIKHQGQLLHAKELTLVHPKSKKSMTFTSELPEHYKIILEKLKNIYGGNDGI